MLKAFGLEGNSVTLNMSFIKQNDNNVDLV
jgi:hypothetical protein